MNASPRIQTVIPLLIVVTLSCGGEVQPSGLRTSGAGGAPVGEADAKQADSAAPAASGSGGIGGQGGAGGDVARSGGEAGATAGKVGAAAADFEDFCAFVSGCLGSENNGVGLGSLCAQWYAALYFPIDDQSTSWRLLKSTANCFQAAASCDAIRLCINGASGTAEICDGSEDSTSCQSNWLVDCRKGVSHPRSVLDCAAMGLVCAQNGTHAGCSEAQCDPASTAPKCDGDARVECRELTYGISRRDCRYEMTIHCDGDSCKTAGMGGTCTVGSEGVPECVGTGPTCDSETSEARCEGTTVVGCRGGRESRSDCAGLIPGMTCVTDPSSLLVNCGLGTECNDRMSETCSNGMITFCMFGTLRHASCTASGHSGCATAPNLLAPEQAAAYCVP